MILNIQHIESIKYVSTKLNNDYVYLDLKLSKILSRTIQKKGFYYNDNMWSTGRWYIHDRMKEYTKAYHLIFDIENRKVYTQPHVIFSTISGKIHTKYFPNDEKCLEQYNIWLSNLKDMQGFIEI